MKKITIVMLTVMAATISAYASVSVDTTAAYVYSDKGSTCLPTNSLVAWIADLDGDGFGDWNTTMLSAEGFTIDSDDILLGIGASGEAGDGLIWNMFEWRNVASPNVQGKHFAMVWFDTAYSAGATGGGENTNYGFFDPNTVVPNDGVSGEVYSWTTQDVGGSYANDTFHANYNTSGIPEPAIVALMIAGGAAIMARRNAKRRGA